MTATAKRATGIVLGTLAAGQFVMALDTTVMNTAIATVADDLGTDVTGIQTAITLYTLVMASLMITGGKIGEILGRKRAFMLGSIIYACGSLTTALAPNLTVLIIGWSGLEGLGAVLIMPAIVALVVGLVRYRKRRISLPGADETKTIDRSGGYKASSGISFSQGATPTAERIDTSGLPLAAGTRRSTLLPFCLRLRRLRTRLLPK